MNKVEEIREGWLRHRLVLQDLLELVDDEQMNFKPWENAFALGDLAVHTATSMHMFAKMIEKGFFGMSDTAPAVKTMGEVVDIVKQYTEKTDQLLQTLTKKQLQQEIEMNGFVASGDVWLSNAKDHEIHHKGQLFTYARMAGVKEVPFSSNSLRENNKDFGRGYIRYSSFNVAKKTLH
ncbi:DinB family protein [Salibacterium aidingense]|uniref:DinB family protein n=1 Tax=Salibacterium aidingense TaxID=384933 RepID=UPI003BBA9A67